ncbi:MAG: Adenylate cyclase 1 [bacterium ADurb.Bin363]|nr:MAG: Adenylate cyclase 1 [bacterium ADurb.Bin363]
MSRLKSHIYSSKVSSAYEKFVPKEFINYLDKESILDVEIGNQVLKEMTVMFSDIRAFTSLSEKMTPQENFNFINAYLKRMEPNIKNNKGFIDKYIGDAIMALFPENPEDAVNAGIFMLQELEKYNERRIEKGYEPIEIGIGIHTGKLMLGTVGGENRMDGTVISDNVNLASRIEGLNKFYGTGILVSSDTMDGIKNKNMFKFRFIDKVRVKGKKEPIEIFEVLNTKKEKELKKITENLNLYENAIKFYQKKEILKALEIFKKIYNIDSGDRIIDVYINRCEKLLKEKINEEWDGVENLYEK